MQLTNEEKTALDIAKRNLLMQMVEPMPRLKMQQIAGVTSRRIQTWAEYLTRNGFIKRVGDCKPAVYQWTGKVMEIRDFNQPDPVTVSEDEKNGIHRLLNRPASWNSQPLRTIKHSGIQSTLGSFI